MDTPPDHSNRDRPASPSRTEIFTEEELVDAFTLLSGNRSFAVNAAAELYRLGPELDRTLFDDAVSALAAVSPSAAERVQKLTGKTDEQTRQRTDEFSKHMRERHPRWDRIRLKRAAMRRWIGLRCTTATGPLSKGAYN
jgi:hypothetical protein